jgi:hypothetical protein
MDHARALGYDVSKLEFSTPTPAPGKSARLGASGR